MLLIFPPTAKPCEPPAGIAQLAAALHGRGLPCRVLDANLEGLLWLLGQPCAAGDTWSRRAAKGRARHLADLRGGDLYRSPDRYSRAVNDLNRLLAVAGRASGAVVGLADYQHVRLSPLRSADLLFSAGHPEQNPFYPWFSAGFEQWLDGVATVGFSLNYLSQALTTFAMIGQVRKRFPALRIVLGGGLVTSWLRRPGWENPFGGLVDHLIAGPGELPLLELLGSAAPDRGRVRPDYTLLPMRDYLAPGFILPYSAAGGCYWNRCSFCPERAEGNRYTPLPVGEALADLHALAAQTRPVLLHLLDNAVSPAFLRAVAADPPGAPWYGFARFGPELADPDFCRALRRSGCVMLKLGLESGDQGVLDRLDKGIDLGEASVVLRNLHAAGIGVYLYLLFGTPAETEAEARRTLEFVVRHHEAVTFMNLAIFNMPICGDEAAGYGEGTFYEGDLSLYTAFRHPNGWDRKQVRGFLDKEFKRHPAVAAIVRNDPPLFTSNHAAFFASGAGGRRG
ncbi:radical SAM protein [Geobacter sp. FeAm09]|uniref:B12-binding domain-containing radical SAM protein n=1 Tax=Geobacter sp. FeAm09 TaxID=2597769 RepID=UPI0011ECD7BE|nr:radical SAM protein [Geobacter sp. FeAm09]QEM67337.1 radical SAM protein [Geobacter sp. FeAm09]